MSNVRTFMFEKGSFYEIRSSVESLAYPKSVMLFTVLAGDREPSALNHNLIAVILTIHLFYLA